MNTLADWSDRVVVVTGAGSGIGASTARRFHAGGAVVVAVDVRDSVRTIAADLGPRATPVVADIATADGWAKVADVCGDLGRVDVLVSNAARQVSAPILDLDSEAWDEQIAVNLTGAYLGMRALLPGLLETAGSIVMVSSVHAVVGLPAHPAYAASKGALAALTRQVAVDYAPVRVNCVLPGPIETPVWDGVSQKDRDRSADATVLKRLGQPDEVASAVEFLASDAASFVTGATLVVDGGWTISKDSA